MSEYARERVNSASDPLIDANDAIKHAFSDMQAALVNRLMGLLAHYETSVFKRLDDLDKRLIELRQDVIALQGKVELLLAANAQITDTTE